jgi:hypothetical protein
MSDQKNVTKCKTQHDNQHVVVPLEQERAIPRSLRWKSHPAEERDCVYVCVSACVHVCVRGERCMKVCLCVSL